MDKVKENIAKNWYWYLGGLALIVALYFIYRAILKAGREPHQKKPPKDIIGEEITPERQQYLTALAEKLHEDIHCILCTRTPDIYTHIAELGDNETVALSNIYNYMYEVEDEETMYQGINGEYYALDGFELRGLVNGILSKLNKLGIA